MQAESKSPRADKQTLEERFAQHPELRTKIESLLSVVENAYGELNQADDAEQAVIEEMRGIGQAALEDWSEQTHEAAKKRFIKAHPKAHRSRKKNSTGTVD